MPITKGFGFVYDLETGQRKYWVATNEQQAEEVLEQPAEQEPEETEE